MRHARKDYDRIQDPAKKIPKDEPVFLLRGQDVTAPKVVRFYAKMAKKAGASKELVKCVQKHAKKMERWQKNKKKKVPDMPKGVGR